MAHWEHMMVTTERSGNVVQLVAVTATGPGETVPGNSPTALLGLLDQLSHEGWELVNAESGPGGWACWLRRERG